MGTLGVNPFKSPIDVAIGVWKWGQYLGPEALESGVDACVASWNRMAPNTFPAMAKATANYMNSQLIKMEALVNGYAEGIALDSSGFVSEGSGENLFLVKKGVLYTPPLTASILPGITRQSILTLAADMKLPIVERSIPREMLYIADEVFFAGTATEVTPVRSIDRQTVGKGTRGEITERIQSDYLAIAAGRKPDKHGWLTPVVPERATAGVRPTAPVAGA
jgi:branched-chain amino acid aminotransferase